MASISTGSWLERKWRALAAVLLVGVATAALASKGADRYEIAFDVQKYYSCLPFEVFLVDTAEFDELERGELVKIKAPDVKHFTGEFEVVKFVVGLPGDRWRITDSRLYLNDQYWGELHLLTFLELEAGSLDGEGLVRDEHVFVLGTTPSSYDSRYWGAIPQSSIKGRAHVLL